MIDLQKLPREVREFCGIDDPMPTQAEAEADAKRMLEDLRARFPKVGAYTPEQFRERFAMCGTATFRMAEPAIGTGQTDAWTRQCEDRMHRVGEPRIVPKIINFLPEPSTELQELFDRKLAHVEELPAGSKIHEAIAKNLYPESFIIPIGDIHHDKPEA